MDAETNDEFDSLTEQQKEDVLNFTAIIQSDDVNQAIRHMKMWNWDLNMAVSMYLEHENQNQGFEQINYQNQQNQFMAQNVALSSDQNPLIQEYREFLRLKEASSDGAFTKLYKLLSSTIYYGIKQSWNTIVPVIIRGHSSPGEEFIYFLDNKGLAINIQFQTGNFIDNNEKADYNKKPFLAMIYLNNENLNQIQLNILKNPQLQNFINSKFHCYGVLATNTDTENIIPHVHSENFPCFAIFRKNLTEKISLIDFIPINSQNQDPQEYLKLLQQVDKEFYKLTINDDKIKKKAIQQDNIRFNSYDQYDYNEQEQQNLIRQNNSQQQKLEMDRQLRQQQDYEYEQQELLMQLQFQKEEEERKKQLKEQEEKIQLEQKIIEQKRQRKKSMSAEPDENQNDIMTVVFRQLDGSRIQRRFLQTDNIQILFDFVDSLENLKFESGHLAKFDLIQTHPPLSLNKMKQQKISDAFPGSNQEIIHVKEEF